MKTNYMGLWKTRTAWYVSKPMTQKQIKELPKKMRILLRENKFHKNNDDGTPRFIFAFAEEDTVDAITFEMEDYKDKMSEMLNKIERIRDLARYGREDCPNYDAIFNYFCDIESECDDILE